ncbi:RNA-guided endonuclease InsQ/TnpB family protein [Kribbella sp. NPDC050124]|uniref:RNA-guided endonuclease InsQ/TnpB family protein n=1 Tax=Kribbella sp. NPDC050124 TaxID=3364114 RepID=UPI00378BC569
MSIVRYRYRVYPTASQRQALVRVFGCVRVVFNDSLRLRQNAHEAGEKLSDSEVQRRVVTLAKATPERVWLAEAPSVALVQACNDARRAYRNWFDSRSGRRKGRRIGRPKRRKKANRQSIRLTRNGFSLRGERLYVAKVGELKVRWSRDLPSVPSSVTVVMEPDGRYYASFVVEVADTPLPKVQRQAGVDLGLSTFATVAATDGTTEKVENPRHLRKAERRLAHAQKAMSRKQKGSANRNKARRRVAVLHRKVRDARADHAHKAALRLIRENQAVHVEDLSIAGLGRTRVAKSVHDAGWGQFLRVLAEKAARYGRAVTKVDRWFPSTRLCSVCGVLGGAKPLSVRQWRCDCGAVHDRDENAARNILAAGQAATACGGGVSPDLGPAVVGEAGTHRSAA